MLKFSVSGNAKLKNIISFSLSSGWSCPFALKCYSKADPVTGKISDGPKTEFRCFTASQEALYPSLRRQSIHNFESLRKVRSTDTMVEMIQEALPAVKKNGLGKVVRIHVGGDFFNQKYFDAWSIVARNNPERIFYAYTKSLQYWINRLSDIPVNFKLTASKGGTLDHLIDMYNLKYAEVVYSQKEADDLGFEIDHDDSHAFKGNDSFALIIHGTQPAGSKAGAAKAALAKAGWTGYHKEKSKKK